MTRLAIFDLDGTLVDSAPDLHAALDRLAAARGLPAFARREVIGMIGDGAHVLVERALAARGQAFDLAALEAFLADYTSHAAVETRLFPGIPEALDRLQAQGWRLAVCTNKPVQAARELLGALGVLDRLAALGGGDSFPVRKPHAGHLLGTMEAAGGSAGGSVMVGDHRNDVRAARGAGIPCVFVGWGYGPLAMADGVPIVTRPEMLPDELGAALGRFGA
jgi:phosphoglycolate phosphatase